MSVVYVVLKTHDSTDVERPYLMVVGANRNEVRLQHHHSTTTPVCRHLTLVYTWLRGNSGLQLLQTRCTELLAVAATV